MSGTENLRPFTSRHHGEVMLNCPVCFHQWSGGEAECPRCTEDEEPSRLAAWLVFFVAVWALIVGVLL